MGCCTSQVCDLLCVLVFPSELVLAEVNSRKLERTVQLESGGLSVLCNETQLYT